MTRKTQKDNGNETNVSFSLPPLPYALDALAPIIDKRTMATHHGKHHAAYIDKLNTAIAAADAVTMSGVRGSTNEHSLDLIIAKASKLSDAIRNNAGGHFNHSLFWTFMTPPDQSTQPGDELKTQIIQNFGSLEKLQTAFNAAGAAHFGSGWVWLIWADNALQITTTPNQDNPVMDDAKVRGHILLVNDVWEHAYYLKYQNKRDAYLKNWWRLVNWAEVNKRFDQAVGKSRLP